MNTRRIALDILQEIDRGAYSNLALDKGLKRIKEKRDRGLITELVYGVLRQQKRLDYIIRQLIKRPFSNLDKVVLIALRLGIYQLEFLDRIPARAAVNETVKALKGLINRGGVGFTNGVLRNYCRFREQILFPNPIKETISYLANYYSHPEWMIKIWLKQYGYDRTLRFCQLNNQPAKLIIRHNKLKIDQKTFLEGFENEGIQIDRLPIPDSYLVQGFEKVKSLPFFAEGGFIVQGEAAILTGEILNPKPGMKVLDLAAGPGGKTTHLAQLMKNKGEIVALDIFDHKTKLIRENCKRLGVKIVKTLKDDGTRFNSAHDFDLILVDAPCSGLGLIRQKPEIKWNRFNRDLNSLQDIQFKMLNNALTLLKSGGILLYSTCTLTYQENQGLVKKFLSKQKNNVHLMDINQDLQRLDLKGYLQTEQMGYLELFPPDSKTEGFFMAKFRKR